MVMMMVAITGKKTKVTILMVIMLMMTMEIIKITRGVPAPARPDGLNRPRRVRPRLGPSLSVTGYMFSWTGYMFLT